MPLSETQKEIDQLKRTSFLSENATLRYLTFAALYVSEGIPIGIIFYAIPAWLAANGKTPMEIATYAGIVILPWSFKIVMAPIMDRYTWLSMGRKRPWIIVGQLGLIFCFLAIGFVNDPLNNLSGLMAVGFAVSFFGAIQDIAIDGMAVDIIPLNQQARANGVMWGSRIIGQSLSLIIGTALINIVGFTNAISSLALIVAILILVPVGVRERPGEKLLPWMAGSPSEASANAQLTAWAPLLKSMIKAMVLPASLLLGLGMLLTGILSGFIDTLLPIFTVQQLNWTNTDYSHVYSAATIIGGCFGMFAGGAIIDLLGTRKMINALLLTLTATIGLFGWFSGGWTNIKFVYSFVILFYLMSTLLTIAVMALAMKLSWRKISASQFTLYMTLNNLGIALGAWAFGYLKDSLPWKQVLLIGITLPFLAIFIYRKINLIKHRKSLESFELQEIDRVLVNT